MEAIFSPEPQFQQGQYHKLSDNVNEWEEQIYSLISSVIPGRLGLSTKLHWSKIDDNAGYAVGSVILSDKSGQSVGVPIIVKQWHLAPLDTLMMDDKAYPLSEDSLKEVFTDSSLATDTISRRGMSRIFESGAMYESTYPPVGGGRYVYSSEKSMMENIEGTLWEEDIEAFKKSATADVLTASKKNGSYRLMSKIAAKKGKKKKKAVRKKSVITVAKKGVNEYSILGNPEGVFDPVMLDADRPTMKKFVANAVGKGEAEMEAVSRIDKDQEYQLPGPKEQTGDSRDEPPKRKLGDHGEIFLYETDKPGSATSCNKFGVYSVKDQAGVTSYGYCFPNIINFNGKKVGLKIFAGKNCCAVQASLSGVPCPDHEVPVPETMPDVGKFGTLVYVDKGDALATVPFTVDSVQMYRDVKGLGVTDFYGNKVSLILSPVAQGITPVKESKEFGPLGGKNTYLIPADMHFFELNSPKKLSENYEKHAALSHDANPLRLLYNNGFFVMKGPDLSKYAGVNDVNFDFDALKPHETSFLLSSFGCSRGEVEWIKQADKTCVDGAKVHGLNMPKVASEIPEDMRINDYIRSLRCNLVKEASVMEDGEPVDAALSLGFINPDNVTKFMAAMPKLKETLSVLSKLLIATRLGMSNIPEEACRAAIQNILRVVKGLRKLGLMGEKQAA
jgi:hypothetical protein